MNGRESPDDRQCGAGFFHPYDTDKCIMGGFQSALEKDVLLEPGQIGVRALRTELECAWVIARARASAASFWGSSSSARSVLTMR